MMDYQNFIEYKVQDPVSKKGFVTRSYDEALGYYDRGWAVVEKNITVCRPSIHISTRSVASMTWNDNPDFERNEHENDIY